MGTCCRYLQMPVLHPAYCYSLQTMIFHVFSFHCIFCTTCFFITHVHRMSLHSYGHLKNYVRLSENRIPDSRPLGPLALVDHDVLKGLAKKKCVSPIFRSQILESLVKSSHGFGWFWMEKWRLNAPPKNGWVNPVLIPRWQSISAYFYKKWSIQFQPPRYGQSLGGFSHQFWSPHLASLAFFQMGTSSVLKSLGAKGLLKATGFRGLDVSLAGGWTLDGDLGEIYYPNGWYIIQMIDIIEMYKKILVDSICIYQ